MLESFVDRSLYFLFALQNPWARAGPWVLGPGWSVTDCIGTGARRGNRAACSGCSENLEVLLPDNKRLCFKLSTGLCEEQG